MGRIKTILGSAALSISKSDLGSVLRGLAIAVAGAAATEITRQLTGANFVINWHDFHIGPIAIAAGSYNATLLVWAGWSAAVNFVRKWATDTRFVPADK